MKCPNCGSISFPGVQQCKKCGHRFASAALDETAPRLAQPSRANAADEIPLAPALPQVPIIDELRPAPKNPAAQLLDSVPVEPKKPRSESEPNRDPTPDPRPQQTWRSELTARVDDFRRRRARARRKPDTNSILKLDFNDVPIGRQRSVSAELIEVPKVTGIFESTPEDVDVSREPTPVLDSQAQKAPEDWLRRVGERVDDDKGRPARLAAADLEVASDPSALEMGPLEIPLGVSQSVSDADAGELVSQAVMLAPRPGRSVAGLLDALILLLGYGMFAVSFWWIGGKISLQPGFLALIGSIFVLLLIAYFAVNVAWASTTPGLLARGLEIRRMDGGRPTVADALLRAFGILVSLAALGLGFVWCLVDSDTLTWHDRMSRTVIAVKGVDESR
ncbi:MAG: RDD family protein [Terriglobia bacterium]